MFRAMPAMIKLGALFSPLFAAAWLVLAAMAFAGISTGTAEAAISVENATVSHRDLIGLPFALLVGVTGVGFWAERLWARYSAVGFWVLTVALGLGGLLAGTATVLGVVEVIAMTAVAWWYFFRKRAVVAYYRALKAAESSAPATPTPACPGA